MYKLYDLMTMAVKFQIQTVASPREILFVTINHFDGIRRMIDSSSEVQQAIDNAHKKFIEAYGQMYQADFYLMRQTILVFFQDCRFFYFSFF